MAKSRATQTSQVKGGYLLPDVETVRTVLRKLKADYDRDPKVRAAVRANPGHVLGERGLSKPIQEELLREQHPDVKAKCFVVSCMCSNCDALSLNSV